MLACEDAGDDSDRQCPDACESLDQAGYMSTYPEVKLDTRQDW